MIITVGIAGQQTIRTAPSNTAALSASTVTLYCSWNSSEGTVEWWRSAGVQTTQITNGVTVNDPSKHGLITNVTAGEYHLQIKSLALPDIGEYYCTNSISYYSCYILGIGKSSTENLC